MVEPPVPSFTAVPRRRPATQVSDQPVLWDVQWSVPVQSWPDARSPETDGALGPRVMVRGLAVCLRVPAGADVDRAIELGGG